MKLTKAQREKGEEMVEELMKMTHKKAMGVFMELVEEKKMKEKQEKKGGEQREEGESWEERNRRSAIRRGFIQACPR